MGRIERTRNIVPFPFFLGSVVLSVILLIIGVPRMLAPIASQIGPGGIILGLEFPFPWYLYILVVAVGVSTLIVESAYVAKSGLRRLHFAMGILIIAMISYFIFMTNYWYPRHGWTAVIFKPVPDYYTVYPPFPYPQYVYYIVVTGYLIISIVQMLKVTVFKEGGS